MSVGELKSLLSNRLISQSVAKSAKEVPKMKANPLCEILQKSNPTLLTARKRCKEIVM
jgi:hypothetical protein